MIQNNTEIILTHNHSYVVLVLHQMIVADCSQISSFFKHIFMFRLQTVEKTELEIRQLKDQYKTELDEANKKCKECKTLCEVSTHVLSYSPSDYCKLLLFYQYNYVLGMTASTPSDVHGMTLNCIQIFIVTGSFLYWFVMRPASQRFSIHSCILIISFIIALFLGTNRLSVLICCKAVNQSIINIICDQIGFLFLLNCWSAPVTFLMYLLLSYLP